MKSDSENKYNFIPARGDHMIICDRSGEKCLRSEAVKEWNGLLVKREYAEKRHPLDAPPPIDKEIVAKDPRPENFIFVEPGDITEDDL